MVSSSKTKTTIASNLIRVSTVLSLIDYYLVSDGVNSVLTVIALCIALGLLLVLAMFIRAGYGWPKWVLLALLIVTIIPDAVGLPNALRENITAGLIAILIDAMQVTALVLLFIRAKDDDDTEEENLVDTVDPHN